MIVDGGALLQVKDIGGRWIAFAVGDETHLGIGAFVKGRGNISPRLVTIDPGKAKVPSVLDVTVLNANPAVYGFTNCSIVLPTSRLHVHLSSSTNLAAGHIIISDSKAFMLVADGPKSVALLNFDEGEITTGLATLKDSSVARFSSWDVVQARGDQRNILFSWPPPQVQSEPHV